MSGVRKRFWGKNAPKPALNPAAWQRGSIFSKMLWRMCDRLRVSIIPILLNLICL